MMSDVENMVSSNKKMEAMVVAQINRTTEQMVDEKILTIVANCMGGILPYAFKTSSTGFHPHIDSDL